MKVSRQRMIPIACAIAAIAIASPAFAKPRKHARVTPPPAQMDVMQSPVPEMDSVMRRDGAHTAAMPVMAPSRARASRRGNARIQATAPAEGAATIAATGFGSMSSSAVVAEARRHLGTNPTGRSSLWCGAFMDMVLKRTGHQGGGNLAHSYANYGTRVSGPQIGALAVMSRGKGGGHVGVVSGIDESGNPIIISGNHNRRVAETVYPKGRIHAYVMPEG